MLVQVVTIGEVFGAFDAVEFTERWQIFRGFGAFVLGEVFGGFEICFDLIQVTEKISAGALL
jgi:hypothetical protein